MRVRDINWFRNDGELDTWSYHKSILGTLAGKWGRRNPLNIDDYSSRGYSREEFERLYLEWKAIEVPTHKPIRTSWWSRLLKKLKRVK